jgi:hypothetical protein
MQGRCRSWIDGGGDRGCSPTLLSSSRAKSARPSSECSSLANPGCSKSGRSSTQGKHGDGLRVSRVMDSSKQGNGLR